jgi:ring-1,2-phenylacetyl-CoA epoxidase subunit PaaC
MVRHFFFDHAEAIRFEMLANSVFEPLSMVARKFKGEIKYHTMHADIFMKKLAAGGEESFTRMQNAINETFGLALGMFEPGNFEAELIEAGIFGGEAELQQRWLDKVVPLLESFGYIVPKVENTEAAFGGRHGIHTPHLQPLLDEMTEVFSIDPGADW